MSDTDKQDSIEATELEDQELDDAVGGLKKTVGVRRTGDPCAGGE